jgi:predicted phosphoribosyltransferase
MDYGMFKDRAEAGQILAEELEHYRTQNPLVLGIPRGGVQVGFQIAKHLECDFSIVIVRKLGHPRQPEAAIGAIAEDKSIYLNPSTIDLISEDQIDDLVEREEAEIERRIELYRDGKPLPPLKDRTVILVDDGAATGATLFATIELCKKKRCG